MSALASIATPVPKEPSQERQRSAPAVEGPDSSLSGLVATTERWLLDRGLPRLVSGYGAASSSAAFLAPKLGVLLVAEGLSLRNPDWPPLANIVAVTAGMLILEVVRRAIGWQQPAGFSRGPYALAVFLLAPAVLQLLFGGGLASIALVVLVNLVAVGLTEIVQAGLLPMLRWSGSNVLRQFGASLGLFARALPLLMMTTTFLFLTGEVWQVVGVMPAALLTALLLMFTGLAVAFVLTQLPEEVQRLSTFSTPEEIVHLCRGTPVGIVAPRLARSAARRQRLRKGEQFNVAFLVGTTVLTQVVLVSLLVGAFFVLFGIIVISPGLAATWTGQTDPEVLVAMQAFGHEVALTASLLRVSSFLAAFTSLYLAVSLVEDETYRREFFGQMVADIQQALAVRLVYRALLDHTEHRFAV